MVNYREILRLRSLGRSYQQICVSVGSSKSTVQEVLNLAKYSGSVVKTQIQSFYNELIYVVEEGEGCSPYAA